MGGTSFDISGVNVVPLGCVTGVERYLLETRGLYHGQLT
jgi:hypothetical protein